MIKIKSEGHLLRDPDPQRESIGTSVHNRTRPPPPILLPAIPPVVCSLGLYKDSEASVNRYE